MGNKVSALCGIGQVFGVTNCSILTLSLTFSFGHIGGIVGHVILAEKGQCFVMCWPVRYNCNFAPGNTITDLIIGPVSSIERHTALVIKGQCLVWYWAVRYNSYLAPWNHYH